MLKGLLAVSLVVVAVSAAPVDRSDAAKRSNKTVAEFLTDRDGFTVRDVEAAVARELPLPSTVSVSLVRTDNLNRQVFILSRGAQDKFDAVYVKLRAADGRPTFALPWREWERLQEWLKLK